MTSLTDLMQITRSPGDPKVLRVGPSARPAADTAAQMLGWFSLAMGAIEILAPERITRALGMEGKENLIRAYGVREVAAGIASLSPERNVGLWSRVTGDVLDIATLLPAYNDDNPKKNNVGLALAGVGLTTLIDLASAGAVTATHSRGSGRPKDFSNRSGWPKGVDEARGAGLATSLPSSGQTSTTAS